MIDSTENTHNKITRCERNRMKFNVDVESTLWIISGKVENNNQKGRYDHIYEKVIMTHAK